MIQIVKKILITGGSGFFGTNAAQILRSQGHSVYCTSSEPSKYQQYEEFRIYPLLEMNVLEIASVLACIEKVQPDVIIHAAAFSAPLACEEHPDHAFAVNVGGTVNVLKVAQILNTPLVFLSTDLVFNGDRNTAQEGFYTEEDTPNARIAYGRSKIAAERVFQESTFDKWIILRTSLMFGGRVAWANGFPQFAIDSLRKQQPTTLFLDQFRTPVFIPDITRVITSFVENFVDNQLFCGKVRGKIEDEKVSENITIRPMSDKIYFGNRNIFHCGGNERFDRVSFVEKCCAIFGVDATYIVAKKMEEVPSYTTRVHDVSLDSEKLRKVGHWKQTDIEFALQIMLPSFQKNVQIDTP
jgi:dTDP-4-dehydrorhamnose reductase